MKNKFYLKIILVSVFLFNFGCKFETTTYTNEYTDDIYRWYSKDYKEIEKTGGKYFLYFDDQLTCNTCKLPILSEVRNEPDIWIITRFDTELEFNAFKKAYKLENPILNLTSVRRHELGTPFLFELKDISMKEPFILDDEKLSDSDWLEQFIERP